METLRFYVPDSDKHGKPVNQTEALNAIAEYLAPCAADGLTAYPCRGFYRNNDGVMIRENTYVLEQKKEQINRHRVAFIARWFQLNFHQESVFWEVN